MDKSIKISIILGTVLISFSIFYYLVIFLPHQSDEKLKAEQELQMAKQQAEQQKAEQIKKSLSDCLNAAQESYRANWADACKGNAKKTQEGYQNCLNEPFMTASICTSTWGKSDDSPNCLLPDTMAQGLDKNLQSLRDECSKFNTQ